MFTVVPGRIVVDGRRRADFDRVSGQVLSHANARVLGGCASAQGVDHGVGAGARAQRGVPVI